jgi:parallel beta-helix repeat protein
MDGRSRKLRQPHAKVQAIGVSSILILSMGLVMINFSPIIGSAPPQTFTVDDDGPADFSTIQEAVNAAQTGDTVFVKSGTYWENVVIDKTLNLTGEDRDTVIINTTDIGILVENVDFVNISNFNIVNGSIIGIKFEYSNTNIITNNIFQNNDIAIALFNSDETSIYNNMITDNNNGIYLSQSNYNNICDNIVANNVGNGIEVRSYSDNNTVVNNTVINNQHGIIIRLWSDNNQISDNKINSNTGIGIYIVISNNNSFLNNTCFNNYIGAYLNYFSTDSNKLINCTIQNSVEYDINITFESKGLVLNTTFDKLKTHYFSTTSSLTVQWFLEVYVTDFLGNPVENANIEILDNNNGSNRQIFTTDLNGYINWIPITEYIEKDMIGDMIGEKTYYDPYKIVAWNETLVGYAYPDPIINTSKTLNIILYNGTLKNMNNKGWNLISIPRIQSDTNVETVLQSIEGCYNAVQWYDASDVKDHWKHHHILKPSYMNDLKDINHSMSFWIDVTDPGGAVLLVFGNELPSNQTIVLRPGWNMIGFPSLSNKTRTEGLNNIFFGTDVDAIWTFNALSKKWIEMEDTSYFVPGNGYWVHSKLSFNKLWDIPL